MANQMRRDAEKSRDDKMSNMGVKITTADLGDDAGVGHVMPAKDGTQGKASGEYAKGYKRGGRVSKDEGDKVEGAKPKMRLDRPHRANGGNVGKSKKKAAGTTVNVIVAGSKPSGPPDMPMGAGQGGPPAMPPQASAGGAGATGAPGVGGGQPMPPQGMTMRKNGGRVGKYTAGAGSGEGREEKIEKYGKNAKEK